MKEISINQRHTAYGFLSQWSIQSYIADLTVCSVVLCCAVSSLYLLKRGEEMTCHFQHHLLHSRESFYPIRPYLVPLRLYSTGQDRTRFDYRPRDAGSLTEDLY